jgi:hypothetical protein
MNEKRKKYRLKNWKNIQKVTKEYRLSHPWLKTLSNIKQRCNNKKFPKYKYYGGRGIKCLITSQELKELWFRDKAHEMKKPSIDRIDNDGNYCIENCRFIERFLNLSLSARKSISKYTLDNIFIESYSSMILASKENNISSTGISACCCGKQKTAGNYIWKFKGE